MTEKLGLLPRSERLDEMRIEVLPTRKPFGALRDPSYLKRRPVFSLQYNRTTPFRLAVGLEGRKECCREPQSWRETRSLRDRGARRCWRYGRSVQGPRHATGPHRRAQTAAGRLCS